jgi:outer membrane receptor protein involved in Fe transport
MRAWRLLLALCLLTLAAWSPLALAQTEATEEPPSEEGKVEETLVVTASRTEERLQDAPAAVTVITGEQLETAPVDDYGDILRNVPGLNVSQMSARDIQVTGRAATNSLAAQQLVLLDGRSVYLDFFGFVMWDLLPVNPRDIKQIEVVRGPGSAVWGANALSGVVNLITKSPREAAGTSVLLGAGELSTLYGSVSHAAASEKLGYKAALGYYEQDPFDRPTGLVPGTNTPYPAFENEGTSQPKLDLRVDYSPDLGNTWSFAAGYAATDGIIHSGIGPFDIDKGTSFSYAKASWSRGSLIANLYANILRGEADNLLTRGIDGRPIRLGFDSNTYNLDASNTSVLADKHILTYGANARRSTFDLSIAPRGDERDEYGAFLQDEILLGSSWRWLLGARVDNLDPIGTVVSPRTTLMYAPTPDHTFRLSYNRAFKSPSVIQNYLDVTIVNLVNLPTGPYIFPSRALGNEDLQEEQLDAYEIGYVGTLADHVTVSLAVYHNETEGSQDFYTASFYTAANPPPGWPLPPFVLNFPPLAGALPSGFSYRNIGETTDEGVELGIQVRPRGGWSYGLNYSFQKEPEVKGIPEDEVNKPPRHRANLDLGYDGGRYFVNGNVNYVDEAVWTDVLDARFHGPTDEFTQVNLSVGVRLLDDKLTFAVIGNNLFDEEIQQHVFGDIIRRKVSAQVIYSW